MEEIIFPNKIRMIRRLRGHSMASLAKILGITLSAISKIEKGYRRISQEQLVKTADFLGCNMADIFLSPEDTGDTGVMNMWKREAERRTQVNEQSGLKALGAGLRYIRGQKNLTLADLADAATMTLSVYHRIEIGQRDVSEDEFASIAKALGLSVNELIRQIYDLKEGGHLQRFIQKSTDRIKTFTYAAGAGEGGSGFYGIKLGSFGKINIKLYGKSGPDGTILINKSEEVAIVNSPIRFDNPDEVYAVKLSTRRLGSLLPTRSILYVDTIQPVGQGDMALVYDKDPTQTEVKAKLVSIREDDKGKLYGVMWNPDEKVSLDPKKVFRLERVVFISLI